MITTDDAREYLNIPEGVDENLLSTLIDAGYNYLRDAVDDFDSIYAEDLTFATKADHWVKHYWTPDGYDQREGGYDGKRTEMNYPARATLTQLQLYTPVEKSKNPPLLDDTFREYMDKVIEKMGGD